MSTFASLRFAISLNGLVRATSADSLKPLAFVFSDGKKFRPRLIQRPNHKPAFGVCVAFLVLKWRFGRLQQRRNRPQSGWAVALTCVANLHAINEQQKPSERKRTSGQMA